MCTWGEGNSRTLDTRQTLKHTMWTRWCETTININRTHVAGERVARFGSIFGILLVSAHYFRQTINALLCVRLVCSALVNYIKVDNSTNVSDCVCAQPCLVRFAARLNDKPIFAEANCNEYNMDAFVVWLDEIRYTNASKFIQLIICVTEIVFFTAIY